MPDLASPRKMRAGVVESVRLDLLGPVEEDEVVFEYRVRDRYLLGMLATDGKVAVSADMAGDDGPDEDKKAVEADDTDSGSAPMLFPSSMGLSFAVEGQVDTLDVCLTWGEYAKVANPIPEEDRPDWMTDDRLKSVWQRTPREETVQLSLPPQGGSVGPVDVEGQHGPIRLTGTCAVAKTGCRLVTLFVHNRQTEPSRNGDEAWLFQPHMDVTTPAGGLVFVGRAEAVGVQVPDETVDGDARERARLDMQYRDRVEFASGHAVAATATPDPHNPRRTDRVATTFLPTHEVRRTAPAAPAQRPQLAGLVSDMGQLATLPAEELRQALLPLADGYADWLAEQAQRVDDEPDLADYRQAAEDALYDAEQVADAIRAGIDLLTDGSDALAAFRFANRAMAEQRLRADAIAARREQDDQADRDLDDIVDEFRAELEDGENPHTRWRPFQLAFVLLNMPALVDPTHRDRTSDDACVDLLFFPTGGGKTEAYLGLVAIAFAVRRLQADLGGLDGSDGVAVLMRYTLRLLTAQQFERAAALVCATEVIRREDPDAWGATPFRLGMWVGGSLTPNYSTGSRNSASTAIADLRDGSKPYGGSPVQLNACPWCGEAFDATRDPRHIYAADDAGEHAKHNPQQRTLVYCPEETCEFGKAAAAGEGIPVVTVDDEVYRLLPTFVIGTIDKFAQLPWNPNVRMLFGRVADQCPTHRWRAGDASYWPDVCSAPTGHTGGIKVKSAGEVIGTSIKRLRPPDLIIQDEFHLITGPLGTLAGLYETAIDTLTGWELDGRQVRAKIVASTATIRRADDQARAVFARRTRVFPPQVLDVDDNFFSAETALTKSPGRLYVGVCASGRRLKEAESRLFRTAMTAAQHQWDLAEPHTPADKTNPADPWMTTVGYFGSIRELAGMKRIADEELITRIRGIEHGRRHFLGSRTARPFDLPDGTRKRLSYQAEVLELTSRVGATDLRATLDRLFTTHRYDLVEKKGTKGPYYDVDSRGVDLVLATNMISVGVDVSRLGMMVVVGQPKTTAEYIQASSRVGRDYTDAPGVVFTLLSWARPRDLSHWETFEHYHDTFYRNVESQSVTPFAPRALDRGATGVLVSLLRGLVDDWAPDRGLSEISAGAPGLDAAVDLIVQRAQAAAATTSQVEEAHDAATKRRSGLIDMLNKATVQYAWRKKGANSNKDNIAGLLAYPEDDDAAQREPWVMPNSLRNTEQGINILIDREHSPPGDPEWDFTAPDDDAASGGQLGVFDQADDTEASDAIDALLVGSEEA